MSTKAPMRMEVRELDVGVPDAVLMRGVTWSLDAGAGLVLRGRSGLGKSTLLRTLSALHADPEDRVRLVDGDGAHTALSMGSPRWRRQLTYIHQRAHLSAGTVDDNLRAPFAYAAARGQEFPAQCAARWLDELGLAGFGTRPARDLSVGEAQRVALVRGLLHRPAFALLDESTSALDPDSRDRALAFLERRRDEGIGMVVVAHSTFGDLPALDLELFRA